MDSKEIGKIIRSKREELGLTQDQVATTSGISKPYLSNIETGRPKNPPTDTVLDALEKALQFNPGELVSLAHFARTPADVRETHVRNVVEIERLRSALRNLMTAELLTLKRHKMAKKTTQEKQDNVISHYRQILGRLTKEIEQEEQDAVSEVSWLFRGGDETPSFSCNRLDPRITSRSQEEACNTVESTKNKNRVGILQSFFKHFSRSESALPSATMRPLDIRLLEQIAVPTVHRYLEDTIAPDADRLHQAPIGRNTPIVNSAGAYYPQCFPDLGYPDRVAVDYVRCPDVRDEQTFGAHVFGDAMEPEYNADDIVVFSPNADVRSGDDCFVRLADGTTTFKRIYLDSDATVRLQPLNNRYPAQILNRDQITGLWPAVCRIVQLRRP